MKSACSTDLFKYSESDKRRESIYTMGSFAEAYYQMGKEESYKEGKLEGRLEGIKEVAEEAKRETLLTFILYVMHEFDLPLQQAMTVLDIPEAELQIYEMLIEDRKTPSITSPFTIH